MNLLKNNFQETTSDHLKITYSVNPEDPYPEEYMGWIDVIDIEGNTHTFKQSC